jgi:hypothetical protein
MMQSPPLGGTLNNPLVVFVHDRTISGTLDGVIERRWAASEVNYFIYTASITA